MEAVSPHVDRIWVLPLFGKAEKFSTTEEAISYVLDEKILSPKTVDLEFVRIEIQARFASGATVDARTVGQEEAVVFLENVDSLFVRKS